MGNTRADYLQSAARRMHAAATVREGEDAPRLAALSRRVSSAARIVAEDQLNARNASELATNVAVLLAVLLSAAPDQDRAIAESSAFAAVESNLDTHHVPEQVVQAIEADPGLRFVAAEYESDVRAHRRSTARLLWTSALSLVIGATVVTVAAARHSTGPGFWRLALAALPFLMIALAAAFFAEHERKAADEALRLQRQIQTLRPYLDEFDNPVRTIVGATLAHRFFGRTLDDLDPLRDPRVPGSDDLLRALGIAGRDQDT